MTTQTRAGSLIEAGINILIGYFVALINQVILFPMFGIDISINDHILIGIWFTIISLARSYLIRRYFNSKLKEASERLAEIGAIHD